MQSHVPAILLASQTRTAILASLLFALPAVAQTGRNLTLGTPPDLGAASSYSVTYPASAAGRLGLFGFTLPMAGAFAIPIPGFTSQGLVRIDLANVLLELPWALDATGTFTQVVSIPLSPAFQGWSFDVQTVDYSLATNDLAWADNDLALSIGQGAVGQGLDMVWIPAGTFWMGSPMNPLDVVPFFNQAVAQPFHPVTITSPFWVGKYEVTQAQYQAVMGSNPSFFVGPQRPVEQVTWADAMAYCAALTVAESAAGRVPSGYQYRLPTEAEWEYCYRAGRTTEYWSGQSIACAHANFGHNFHTSSSCSIGQTASVGSYPANPWGLHDVAGNVFEWCLDAWDVSANYPTGAVADPFVGSGPVRMFRGGSYASSSAFARAAYRFDFLPGIAVREIGFRVVLAPILVP